MKIAISSNFNKYWLCFFRAELVFQALVFLCNDPITNCIVY